MIVIENITAPGKEIIIDNVIRERYFITIYGELYDLKYKRYITGHVNKGYLRVTLMCDNNKQKSYYIHVLVKCIYDKDMRLNMTVNHEDGDKLNNRLENLTWMTYRNNLKHAIDTGLIKDKSMLTEDVVHKICNMLQDGYIVKDIARQLHLNKATIFGVRSGFNWEDISSQYVFDKRDKYIKLDENKVESICKDISLGLNLKQISDKYDAKYSTIGSIKQKITWKHISDKYF